MRFFQGAMIATAICIPMWVLGYFVFQEIFREEVPAIYDTSAPNFYPEHKDGTRVMPPFVW